MDFEKLKLCHTRGPFLRNSLNHEIKELRKKSKLARGAYEKDFMKEPCEFLADAYDESASILEKALEKISWPPQPCMM